MHPGMLYGDKVLEGSPVLTQINNVLNRLSNYDTGDASVSYEEYFKILSKQVGEVRHFDLNSTVTPGVAHNYLLQVSADYEATLDDCERVGVKLIFFAGKLKASMNQCENLMNTFSAWYMIEVQNLLNSDEKNKIKLPMSTLKSLAESEFTRLMNEKNLDLEAMYDAVQGYVDLIKSTKKLAAEKYKLATDQVNISLSSNPDGGGRAPRQMKNLDEQYGQHFKPENLDDEEEGGDLELERKASSKLVKVLDPVETSIVGEVEISGDESPKLEDIVRLPKGKVFVDPMLGETLITEEGDLVHGHKKIQEMRDEEEGTSNINLDDEEFDTTPIQKNTSDNLDDDDPDDILPKKKVRKTLDDDEEETSKSKKTSVQDDEDTESVGMSSSDAADAVSKVIARKRAGRPPKSMMVKVDRPEEEEEEEEDQKPVAKKTKEEDKPTTPKKKFSFFDDEDEDIPVKTVKTSAQVDEDEI